MGFAKKVAIAVELDSELHDVLKDVRGMSFLNSADVHVVHVSRTISYNFGIDGTPLVYPIEDDRRVIRESVLETLKKNAKDFLPKNLEGRVSYHCLFGEEPKRTFSHFLDEEKIDLVIVATKQKHGFFESSFAQYVNKHTKADVLMLKR